MLVRNYHKFQINPYTPEYRTVDILPACMIGICGHALVKSPAASEVRTARTSSVRRPSIAAPCLADRVKRTASLRLARRSTRGSGKWGRRFSMA